MRRDAVPPLNVIGVYMEPTSVQKDTETVQKVLTDKVQRCLDYGENCVILGDTNAAVNKDSNQRTPAAKQMLAWEASTINIILNVKHQLTRVPYRKGDLGII